MVQKANNWRTEIFYVITNQIMNKKLNQREVSLEFGAND